MLDVSNALANTHCSGSVHVVATDTETFHLDKTMCEKISWSFGIARKWTKNLNGLKINLASAEV